jgi:hypothetical protein
VGTELTVRLLPPYEEEDSNPMSHFLASVTDLFEDALRNCDDSDMVEITTSNKVNVQNKAVAVSFRRIRYIRMRYGQFSTKSPSRMRGLTFWHPSFTFKF